MKFAGLSGGIGAGKSTVAVAPARRGAVARIARQLARKERLGHADFVIDNSGSEERLEPQIGAAWEWMRSLPDAVPVLDT